MWIASRLTTVVAKCPPLIRSSSDNSYRACALRAPPTRESVGKTITCVHPRVAFFGRSLSYALAVVHANGRQNLIYNECHTYLRRRLTVFFSSDVAKHVITKRKKLVQFRTSEARINRMFRHKHTTSRVIHEYA